MRLFLMTQHSPDGATPGVQTMGLTPTIVELGPVDFEVQAGGQFFLPAGGIGVAFQFPQAVNAFGLGDGNYLQVEDKIVMMGDNMLKFAAPIVDREVEKAKAAILSEGFD